MPHISGERMPIIAGVDEVGRGPLAGPVVASAVVLNNRALIKQLKDSKKCTPRQRERLYDLIVKECNWSIGQASVKEIDKLNIFQATMLAMERAIEALDVSPDEVLIDGPHAPKGISMKAQCIIKGDEREPAISAASIIAKVTRDRMMAQYADQFPGFGFESHKGYGTKAHMDAIAQLGVCPIHRKTFRPVRVYIESMENR